MVPGVHAPLVVVEVAMNIVVSNVKGGVGKTTTTVYLAAAAADRGWDPVLLVDADRQASSAEWFESRPVEGVELVEAPSERTVGRAMTGHRGLAVVDTPPGDERIVRAALERADAVVVPTRAGRRRVLAGGGHPRDDPSEVGLRHRHLCGPAGHERPGRGRRVVDEGKGPGLGHHPRAGRASPPVPSPGSSARDSMRTTRC